MSAEERRAFSRGFWTELAAVGIAIALLLFAWPAFNAWIKDRPFVQTSGQACRAPGEHETLVIQVAHHGGDLVILACKYGGNAPIYHRRGTQ